MAVGKELEAQRRKEAHSRKNKSRMYRQERQAKARSRDRRRRHVQQQHQSKTFPDGRPVAWRRPKVFRMLNSRGKPVTPSRVEIDNSKGGI